MTMETGISIQLAADVMGDHFGTVVQRVGVVLLERGSLTVQDIMRWVGQARSPVAEPLRFPHVRNALLTMVQHGFVTAKPAYIPENDAALRVVPQVYSIDADDVLSRLHFAHYLEYTGRIYGALAQRILLLVLQNGRAGVRYMHKEVMRVARNNYLADEVDLAIQRLAEAGMLRPVQPWYTIPSEFTSAEGAPATASASVSSTAVVATPSSSSTTPSEGPLKRKRDNNADGNAAPSDARSNGSDLVYTYNRPVLNLCLCKSLIGRLVEERGNEHAARVMEVLLTGIGVEYGRITNPEFMKFSDIYQRMVRGHHIPEGRDPEREAAKIQKALSWMVSVGFAKTRTATQTRAMNADPGAAEQKVDEWQVDWPKVKSEMERACTSQLIRDQFGIAGLRIFNLLNERTPKQKLEEREISSKCMVKPEETREVLNNMVLRHIINWQEVAKREFTSQQPFGGSFWFYYIDESHVKICILHDVYQALLNLRVRFRTEVARTAPLESRCNSLNSEEKAKLMAGRRSEDILERSFLVLDAALLVYRHF